MPDETTAADTLAAEECALYLGCVDAVEPPDSPPPTTHLGTMSRKNAFREGRLIGMNDAEAAAARADGTAGGPPFEKSPEAPPTAVEEAPVETDAGDADVDETATEAPVDDSGDGVDILD